jgi:hypothetical protein
MKLIALDDERDPHPQCEERLKIAPPASNEEMQSLMRRAHQDQNIRAAVVAHARTQLDDQAAPRSDNRIRSAASALRAVT